MSFIETSLFAVLVLMVWSGLYRTTWVFRIAESMIIGLYLGFISYNGVNIFISRVWDPIVVQGNWINPVWFAVILGILSWARFNKDTAFLARWPLAFLAAVGTGLAVTGSIKTQIIGQLTTKLWSVTDIGATFNQIVLIISTVSVLIYFTFSFKRTGVIGNISRLGRLLLMVQIGVIFGTMQMGNYAIPIGLVDQLSRPPALYFLIIAVLIIAVDIWRRRAGIEIDFPLE